ncbi:MAG TPA: PBS lyase [Cyanobacteria bacterium UBA8553]|nr:PBS lyase [Cyanobacteria bacterium UBA8553]HAJ61238.1 PBS lyase [Cyanobacteria bacterium UBA8543]
MSKALEHATAAAQEGNWSLLNQCLQQLPLGTNSLDANAESAPLNDTDLEQVLNLALDVLSAGDFQERWEVAKVFPKLGLIAIAPLIEILQDEDADLELRWFTGRILGEFNHPTVITTLVELLKTSEDEDLVAMAATALSSVGESAVDALASLLADPESRLLATKSLSQIRRPETIAPLLGVVGDSQVAVRSTAIEALSNFHDPRIQPILLDALDDRAAVVRKQAVIGLGLRWELQEQLNLLNRLKPLLYDFNIEVCQQVAIALGRLKTDEAAHALFDVLKSPATPHPLTFDIIRALGWMETVKSLDYLQQALAGVSVECAIEIIRVLGRSEEPVLKTKAAQILIDFLNSEHPAATAIPVKQALAEAWGQLGEDGAIDVLLELLGDSEDSVRLHAIAALKNFSTARQQLEQLATVENLTPELKQGIAIALAQW